MDGPSASDSGSSSRATAGPYTARTLSSRLAPAVVVTSDRASPWRLHEKATPVRKTAYFCTMSSTWPYSSDAERRALRRAGTL